MLLFDEFEGISRLNSRGSASSSSSSSRTSTSCALSLGHFHIIFNNGLPLGHPINISYGPAGCRKCVTTQENNFFATRLINVEGEGQIIIQRTGFPFVEQLKKGGDAYLGHTNYRDLITEFRSGSPPQRFPCLWRLRKRSLLVSQTWLPF